MQTMAINQEKLTLSPLPKEVKKLQEMSDNLFAQMKSYGVPVHDGEMAAHPFVENKCIASPVKVGEHRPPSEASSKVFSTPERTITSPTFINPLDYSVHTKSKSSITSTRSSPAVKSCSSGASFMGSFSSSNSPSPTSTEGASGTFHLQNERQTWKTKSVENKITGSTQVRSDIRGNSDADRGTFENLSVSSGKFKSKGKFKRSENAGSPSSSFVEEEKSQILENDSDGPRANIKRHNSVSTGANNAKNSTSTAAYKYLTWREKDRRRRFREEWKHLWLVVPHGRYEVMCLVCHKVMTQRKLDTIKRHTVRRHVELLGMPQAERQNLFEQLLQQHSMLSVVDSNQSGMNTVRTSRKSNEFNKPNLDGLRGNEHKERATNKELPMSTCAWLSQSPKGSKIPLNFTRSAPHTQREIAFSSNPENRSTYLSDQAAHQINMDGQESLSSCSTFRKQSTKCYPTANNSSHVPFTESNTNLLHGKRNVFGEFVNSLSKFSPSVSAMHGRRPNPPDVPFQFSPNFQPTGWSPIQRNDSSTNACTFKPNPLNITPTFTQILEQITTTRPAFCPPNLAFSGRENRAGVLESLENAMKSVDRQFTQPEEKISRSQQMDPNAHDLNSAARYKRNMNSGFTSDHSNNPLQQQHDRCSAQNSPDYSPNTNTMTAIAMAAQSLLRLPPPSWTSKQCTTPTNQPIQYPNPMLNPAFMATWAALMASISANDISSSRMEKNSMNLINTGSAQQPQTNFQLPVFSGTSAISNPQNINKEFQTCKSSKQFIQNFSYPNEQNAIWANGTRISPCSVNSMGDGVENTTYRRNPNRREYHSNRHPHEIPLISNNNNNINNSNVSVCESERQNNCFNRKLSTHYTMENNSRADTALSNLAATRLNSNQDNLIHDSSPSRSCGTSYSDSFPHDLLSSNKKLPLTLQNSLRDDKTNFSPTWLSSLGFTSPNSTPLNVSADSNMAGYIGEILRQKMSSDFHCEPNLPRNTLNERIHLNTTSPQCTLLNEDQYIENEAVPELPDGKILEATAKIHNKNIRADDTSHSPKENCSPKWREAAKADIIGPEESRNFTRPDPKLSPLWSINFKSEQSFRVTTNETTAAEEEIGTHANTATPIHGTFDFQLLRLGTGQNLRETLSRFVERCGSDGAFIITCCGSLQSVRLRLADLSERTLDGPFEIVSLTGTLTHNGQPHLHIALSDSNGAVIGGHLLGSDPVHTTAEIVLGCLGSQKFRLKRPHTFENDGTSTPESDADLVPIKKRKSDEMLRQETSTRKAIRLVRKRDHTTGFDELNYEQYYESKE